MKLSKKVVSIIFPFLIILTSCVKEFDTQEYEAFDKTLGIGKYLYEQCSSDRSYDWYIDQGTTGKYGNINCGPSAIWMALKWNHRFWDVSVEKMRETAKDNGALWDTKQVRDTLDKYLTKCKKVTFHPDTLLNDLRSYRIVVFCMDMHQVTYNSDNTEHSGRFYNNVGNHFIVGKGFKITDVGTWIECYDPFSMGLHYYNREPKGKDRYYLLDEVEIATKTAGWYSYIRVE